MPRPEPTEIRIDERGSETHESWLLVRAGRVSSSPGARLFDSEISHQHYISVTVERCKRERRNNRDWHFGTERIIEFDMSEAQWGAFVSSFGNGGGVPATLSFFCAPDDVPTGMIPQAPVESRLDESHKEVREAGAKAVEEIQQKVTAVVEAYERKAGRREMGPLLDSLKWGVEHLPGSMEFAASSLTEHVENVVTKARSDIEGMALMVQEAQALPEAHHLMLDGPPADLSEQYEACLADELEGDSSE